MEANNEIGISVESSPDGRMVRVRGTMCLPNLEVLRRALLDGLPSGQPATLDLSGVTAIDLSGLQLICSAHRTFRRRRMCFAVTQRPEWLRVAAGAAGYDASTSVCPFRVPGDCIWAEEVER